MGYQSRVKEGTAKSPVGTSYGLAALPLNEMERVRLLNPDVCKCPRCPPRLWHWER